MALISKNKLPPECDILCQWRKCLHPGENKGPFTPGRGYTSYYSKPEPACMTRITHGCPGIAHRPTPKKEALVKDLESEMESIRMTRKTERFCKQLIGMIRELVSLIEKDEAFIERVLAKSTSEHEKKC